MMRSRPQRKVVVQLELAEPFTPAPPTIDDIRMFEWEVRSHCCNSIQLGLGTIARYPEPRTTWLSVAGKSYNISALAKIQPSCSLRTRSLVDLVEKIIAAMAPHLEVDNLRSRVMFAAIARSCQESIKRFGELESAKAEVIAMEDRGSCGQGAGQK